MAARNEQADGNEYKDHAASNEHSDCHEPREFWEHNADFETHAYNESIAHNKVPIHHTHSFFMTRGCPSWAYKADKVQLALTFLPTPHISSRIRGVLFCIHEDEKVVPLHTYIHSLA